MAAEDLAKLYYGLRSAVFDGEEESLGQIVATVTLQVVCPPKHMFQNQAWSKTMLNNSLNSVLSQVRNHLVRLTHHIWHGKVPYIRFTSRGMLDFVEDCGLDVKTH